MPKPFILPDNIPPETAAQIVSEVPHEMVRTSARIMGENSVQGIVLKRCEEQKWQCRVFKLRNRQLIVIPNEPAA